MSEEVEHPIDAYLFASLGVIIFLFNMLNYLYAQNTRDLLVFVIYAISQVMALVFGAILIQAYNSRGD
jgi:hypothetical protein